MSGRDNEGTAEKGGRGRRRPPTIEATAERLADNAVTPETPTPDAPAPQDVPAQDVPAQDGPVIETPPAPHVTPEATEQAVEAPAAQGAEGVAEPVEPPVSPPRPQRASLVLPVGLAAVIGALVAFGGSMLLQQKPGNEPALASLTARLGTLETRVAALDPTLKTLGERIAATEAAAGRPAASAGAAPDLGPLEQRLGALESTLKQLPATGAENGAAEKLASLGSAQQQQESRLAALQEKFGAVTASEARAQTQIAAPATLAVAQALGQALNTGRPYATELAALGRLGVPDETLAPLQGFAAAGAPTNAALATEFARLAEGFAKPQQPAAERSLTERLLASAAHLVRIRPVGTPAGDDLAAVSARIEASLRRGDLTAVASDAGKLPAEARQQAKPVLDKARARSEAATALARIEQGVFTAIASGH